MGINRRFQPDPNNPESVRTETEIAREPYPDAGPGAYLVTLQVVEVGWGGSVAKFTMQEIVGAGGKQWTGVGEDAPNAVADREAQRQREADRAARRAASAAKDAAAAKAPYLIMGNSARNPLGFLVPAGWSEGQGVRALRFGETVRAGNAGKLYVLTDGNPPRLVETGRTDPVAVVPTAPGDPKPAPEVLGGGTLIENVYRPAGPEPTGSVPHPTGQPGANATVPPGVPTATGAGDAAAGGGGGGTDWTGGMGGGGAVSAPPAASSAGTLFGIPRGILAAAVAAVVLLGRKGG